MLHLTFSNDQALLDKLAGAISAVPFPGRVGYVLLADDVPAGLAYATADPQLARIHWLGVLPKLRGRGYGDFFTRVLLDHFSRVSDRVLVASHDPYFLQFSMHDTPEGMCVDAQRLTFPHPCQKEYPHGTD